MIERLARTILFLGLTIPHASFGQQSVLNYLYTEFNEGKQQQTITTIMNGSMSADAQEELAYAEAETLMIERSTQPSPAKDQAAGQWLANAAMLAVHAGRPDQGLLSLSEALDLLNAEGTPFAPELFKAVMARGISAFQVGNFDQAKDDFQWGQNILHRNDGVLTFSQAEACLLYTSPSPRDRQKSRMPSSA